MYQSLSLNPQALSLHKGISGVLEVWEDCFQRSRAQAHVVG
jgi:hypothetical protein